ncbi:rho GTPase-activating protein 45-like isoform X2 [Corvus kubaryi]|uniref:rho GTPase-activating protein 45-like isoform X2 n=1 Tax=Corvus kubaryi TaxID=68294 RepID=UPI001C03FCA6|nr:rho GTPase-activating protein 45-like isoform X2 [Corvus kubaryi]
MFSRKKRELIKTPSISKKSRAGSPVPQTLPDLSRKDCLEAPGSSVGEQPPASAKLSSSPSAVGTLKRPTSLSRHASAAGFPLHAAPRAVPKGHKTPLCYSPMEGGEGPFIDSEDISQMLADVARFADALEKLRDVVLRDDSKEPQRPLAHECLGETLRILRQVINKYPLLNTLETLTAAGTLISKVKGFHYESNNEADKREFEKAIETIAVSFSSTVSEFLMGEVDSSTILSIPPSDQNQTMESLYGGIPGPGGDGVPSGMDSYDTACPPAEEVDVMLQRCEGGVDAALQYAKTISKYMKDLIGYLEKRTTLEMEFAKGLQKMANSCKQTISQETNMPFLSIYLLALEQDMEHGTSVLQAANTLQHQTFLQPLTVRRLEHEKRRKEIKEQWHRAQRKLQEAEGNLRKAKQTYMQRSEEHDKAKYMAVKAEEEQQNTTSSITTKALDKKRRLEEEAKNKAEEAMATYRTCVADANTQKQELEDTKVNSLRQIHEVIKQTDQVVKSATISFYQLMHMQTAPLPVNFQTLCESSKLYDPGQQYASHVRQLQRGDEPDVQYDFEPYVSHNAWSPFTRARKGSFNASEFSTSAEGAGAGSEGAAGAKESPSGAGAAERRGGRGHQVHKSWPTSVADADSNLDSNTGEFGHKLQRLSSNGTASSSEELEEKDGTTTPFEQSINGITPELATPTGPFRNVGLSKAAQTHRLRKLRAPSKCRECNSYVYFQGAECEECYLACHKKCLETLAIQCGHKKLQGKLQLFGQDFMKASQGSPDGIPFIVKKCISEIEKRALKTKGIYRVNGVKTRVEKLCQAFENGKELVELSQASPHDISNVLKLYLRQVRCWWCLVAGEGGEVARGTNLAGGILHKLGSVTGWEERGPSQGGVGWPWRWGHSDPPQLIPHSITAVTAAQQRPARAPNKERSAPSNWGTGYPKREGASKGHPAQAESRPHGVGSAPGVKLGWVLVRSLPLGHLGVGLSGISAPQVTLRGAQRDLCPSGHPKVGSAPAPPTPYPNCRCRQCHPHPPTASTARQERRGSCFSLAGSRGLTLCAAFLCNSSEGQLCVTSQGKPCPWAPAHQESRTLSCLRGFSKEKQNGMRGGNQC